MKPEQQVIVITGGAGLLGRDFAGAIAARGDIAIVADIDEVAACRSAEEIAANSPLGSARGVMLDITDRASIEQLIKTLMTDYGRIDAVVNSAYPRNAHYGRHFFEVEYEDLCDNLNRHLGGYFLVSQQFAAQFKRQGYGHIVNLASIYGVVAPRFEIYAGTEMTMPVEYALIKSAVIQLTRYLAAELKGCNIHVNAISPGGIADGQPQAFLEAYRDQCLSKGMLDPGEVTSTLLFLLSDASRAINGQNLIVDDGFCL